MGAYWTIASNSRSRCAPRLVDRPQSPFVDGPSKRLPAFSGVTVGRQQTAFSGVTAVNKRRFRASPPSTNGHFRYARRQQTAFSGVTAVNKRTFPVCSPSTNGVFRLARRQQAGSRAQTVRRTLGGLKLENRGKTHLHSRILCD
jgi:hypothetical protein